jgi:hypothetical protein
MNRNNFKNTFWPTINAEIYNEMKDTKYFKSLKEAMESVIEDGYWNLIWSLPLAIIFITPLYFILKFRNYIRGKRHPEELI